MTDNAAPARAPWWRTLVRVITAIEMTIAIACLITIAALVFFQALQRYLPIEQIAWTGEVSQFCLVWLTFAVAGVLITTRGHIALEVIDGFRGRTLVRIVQTIAMLLSALFAVLLVVEAIELIGTQGIIKSPVLRLPMSLVYIPILVGVASTAVRSLIQAAQIAITGPILPDVEDDAEVVA
ncbi:TRAP transporter small permease [Microbacterium halophytorum]|uniref:TRAP transporter small permease n=1 Tax=Microbacterium halophytorum TaxID=2067568 RepID=UPI000CFA9FBA|nr:TRAP transporter small permease subunit [Microbacterium halophytorum]